MTRSEAKEACKKFMVVELRDAIRTPPCDACGERERAMPPSARAGFFSEVRRGCSGCALMAEEWGKLQDRLRSLLRKEMAAATARKSDGDP